MSLLNCQCKPSLRPFPTLSFCRHHSSPLIPHLQSLCEDAVVLLRSKHDALELQVKEVIAAKSCEMSDLQDRVRAEIELLWELYKKVPGRLDVEVHRKSMEAQSRSNTTGKKVGPSPAGRPRSRASWKENPIIAESVMSPPQQASASLLSASLSVNALNISPSKRATDKVDDSLARVTKAYGKGSDARAVAMSHVFSVLDEAMAGRPIESSQEVETESQEAQNEHQAVRDSWREEEQQKARQDRPEGSKDHSDPNSQQDGRPMTRKGKDKAVTFQEPDLSESESASDGAHGTKDMDGGDGA